VRHVVGRDGVLLGRDGVAVEIVDVARSVHLEPDVVGGHTRVAGEVLHQRVRPGRVERRAVDDVRGVVLERAGVLDEDERVVHVLRGKTVQAVVGEHPVRVGGEVAPQVAVAREPLRELEEREWLGHGWSLVIDGVDRGRRRPAADAAGPGLTVQGLDQRPTWCESSTVVDVCVSVLWSSCVVDA
jgi:hypothetical protein